MPDIAVFGFQEIVDLNAANVLLIDHSASKPWDDRIEAALQQKFNGHTYVKIAGIHMVGLSLSVFARSVVAKYVSDVATETVGTGLMGLAGNKGAVLARLSLFDTQLCFINSHLAAHAKNVAARNNDFATILQRARFDGPLGPKSQPLKTSRFDQVYWLGDLNYRLTLQDWEHVVERVALEDWSYLLEHDQLVIEKRAGRTFMDFHEGPVTFAPTYKYAVGSLDYDSAKARVPAWCDRVQWRTEMDVQLIAYRRAELLLSDHRPVGAHFRIPIRVPDLDKRKSAAEKLRGLKPSDCVPKVTLSADRLEFGRVRFGFPVVLKVRVTNIGKVAAQIFMLEKGFVQLPALGELRYRDSFVGPSWLSVSPYKATLQPKEQLDVSVTVNIGRQDAQAFFLKPESALKAALLVRLEGVVETEYKDLSVKIRGEYIRSCLGLPLSELNRRPTVPMRLVGQVAEPTTPQEPSLVPKELFQLLDALVAQRAWTCPSDQVFPVAYRGATSPAPADGSPENPFVPDALSTQVLLLFECLDVGCELTRFPFSVSALGAALLHWLRSLPKPLLSATSSTAKQLLPGEPGTDVGSWCAMTLSRATDEEYQTLAYLLSFLRGYVQKAPVAVEEKKAAADKKKKKSKRKKRKSKRSKKSKVVEAKESDQHGEDEDDDDEEEDEDEDEEEEDEKDGIPYSGGRRALVKELGSAFAFALTHCSDPNAPFSPVQPASFAEVVMQLLAGPLS